jgi:sodium pump decarboxylase gamma subunit
LSNIFLQGLSVSVAGLVITFLSLGLFALIMILLLKLFPWKPEKEETTTPQDSSETVIVAETTQNEEVVAAISVALAYLK